MEFIDELTDNLTSATRYCVDPSLSEPIRGQWNEEYLADTQKMLDDLKADLATAEPADQQMIEENIRDMEENLEYFDTYGWDVSPREIEWYRAHAENLSLAKVNWLYSDDSGEAWELMNQYREGQISGPDMLAAIDKKVQMMLLEGN